jgi:hypothetical protein
MNDFRTVPSDGWSARLIHEAAEIQRIAVQLEEIESPKISPARRQGGPQELESGSTWNRYELARLILAAARLRFGVVGAFQMARLGNTKKLVSHSHGPTLGQIVSLALRSDFIRKSVFAYSEGGAAGLFEAYEAICQEIMNRCLPDYARGAGTKEWLIEQGWIRADEDDRFLRTVLHFRCHDGRRPSFASFSPLEADEFVRRVLVSVMKYSIEEKR